MTDEGFFKNIFSDKYKLAVNTPSLKGRWQTAGLSEGFLPSPLGEGVTLVTDEGLFISATAG